MNMQSLRHKVSQIYYTYGLFCASHPFATIVSVSITVIVTCYPLSNLPLSGNTPIEHRTSKIDFVALSVEEMLEEPKAPRWFVKEPVAYVQQVVVKTAVSPWRSHHMMPADAFRAPLASVFSVLNELDTFKTTIDGQEVSLSDMCYRVSEPTVKSKHLKGLLPEYSCFIVSPANFWSQDVRRFNKDADITLTLYKKYGPVVESPPTTKDLFFGIPWSETGISRYYIRNRQRVISFAVTIVMKKYDARFTQALQKWMEDRHPETVHNVNNSEVEEIAHIHFKDTNYIIEYTPLLVTYLLLLLYLYFSVSKIDMVKSKIGLAFSAVVTVVASLMMSVSICTLFGMTPTLNGGEIFPYLVVIIGVENVLVITKSVVSTPVHLDVKIRVAQGLSREGWYITKNLLTELSIMFVGFFTFVPAIQEFCTFALVGVMSDYYLQMAFFATVLSLDIRRMELSDLARQSVQQAVQQDDSGDFCAIEPMVRCPFVASSSSLASNSSKGRQSSHHRQSSSDFSTHGSRHSSTAVQHKHSRSSLNPPKYEMPRRIKFFYFIAKFRLVQKLIMVCTVIWIILFMYKAGLVDKFTGDEEIPEAWNRLPGGQVHPFEATPDSLEGPRPEDDIASPSNPHMRGMVEEEPQSGLVEHTNLELWRKLSPMHWPMLLRCFNISLTGRYISILPVIHLSDIIDPLVAIELRHPIDKATMAARPSFTHQTSYNGDSQIAENISGQLHYYYHQKFDKYYPKSRDEFVITVMLCILSVIVITYFMVMLYRCMCSRNYSRWRHSWARSSRRRSRGYFKQIKESVPLVLSGHTQSIECLLGENGLIVSCCLGGHLKIWDSNSGECINTISRKSPIPATLRKPCVGRNIEDSDADLYAEYHGGTLASRSSSDTSLNIGNSDNLSNVDARGDGIRIRKGYVPSSSYSDLTSLWQGGKRLRKSSSKQGLEYSNLDITTSINTEFSSMEPCNQTSREAGYEFQRWFEDVDENPKDASDNDPGKSSRVDSSNDLTMLSTSAERSCSFSFGDPSALDMSVTEEDLFCEQTNSSMVWCLASMHGQVVTGCGDGRIEVWEAETGELRYHYSISQSGVTGLCVVANKIVAARLDGSLDFLEMETFQSPLLSPPSSSPPPPRQHRGHTRNYSSGSIDSYTLRDEVLRCSGVATVRAHQLPINAVRCAGGRIVTASQDHTLKVFRLDNSLCLYTLHGHEGSVTALYLDQVAPFAAMSGSLDGSVRLWDLLTGTCVHKFKWHEAAVVSLMASPLYIVSIGLDDKMCVCERTKSELLHTITLESGGVGSATLMSRNLVVTGGQNSVSLWDIPHGSLLRKVVFSDSEHQSFPNHVVAVANNGVVCDQGQDLKVVFFPTILEKAE
ncbi:sterol regulatory element-binding protein cleavage-activating protein [Plakobranchus ocellatus]|uniref:Sterol regulatory element-binding protein cleavage-activating protein n=1 Tax=Plakobranchus ocellatus TaxID=259542 RepID=A0AAV3XWZ5_9GAST|nr:sterol regulatory element-binding protein cleavage-activating protein [Plakobranchus ocellatus]